MRIIDKALSIFRNHTHWVFQYKSPYKNNFFQTELKVRKVHRDGSNEVQIEIKIDDQKESGRIFSTHGEIILTCEEAHKLALALELNFVENFGNFNAQMEIV